MSALARKVSGKTSSAELAAATAGLGSHTTESNGKHKKKTASNDNRARERRARGILMSQTNAQRQVEMAVWGKNPMLKNRGRAPSSASIKVFDEGDVFPNPLMSVLERRGSGSGCDRTETRIDVKKSAISKMVLSQKNRKKRTQKNKRQQQKRSGEHELLSEAAFSAAGDEVANTTNAMTIAAGAGAGAGAGAASAGAGAGACAAAPPSIDGCQDASSSKVVKSDVSIHTDERGKLYSWNAATGVAVWLDEDKEEEEGTPAANGETEESSVDEEKGDTLDIHVDEFTGKRYSVNARTGESAWLEDNTLSPSSRQPLTLPSGEFVIEPVRPLKSH
jgi:hypothetical protein